MNDILMRATHLIAYFDDDDVFLSADTKSIVKAHTFFCTTQVNKIYRTKNFTTALEAESQGYRHLLNRTFCNCIRGKTTGLQKHS